MLNKIKAHFEKPENCYDVERTWIEKSKSVDGTSSGIEVVMIEYRGELESVICWRIVFNDFGSWRFGTIEDLLSAAREYRAT